MIGRTHTLTVSDAELCLLWLGTENLRDANDGDDLATALDEKVSALVREAGLDDRDARAAVFAEEARS